MFILPWCAGGNAKEKKEDSGFFPPGGFKNARTQTHRHAHTHTHVLVENGGDLPGAHIVPTIYIYICTLCDMCHLYCLL